MLARAPSSAPRQRVEHAVPGEAITINDVTGMKETWIPSNVAIEKSLAPLLFRHWFIWSNFAIHDEFSVQDAFTIVDKSDHGSCDDYGGSPAFAPSQNRSSRENRTATFDMRQHSCGDRVRPR